MTQQSQISIYLIDELIESNMVEQLKEIREGFTKWMPIELIHIQDRIICEKIDTFLGIN